ncbi:MAG: T9SS type A sorting domain-containing protein [Bacteroidetes bacterium]|nr:T9SS type A sorting domain-containing protein [Bacteroidota bacterium]
MNCYKLVVKCICALLVISNIRMHAQEQLRPLSRNGNLPAISSTKTLSKVSTSTLTPINLPFFDDFSYAYKSPYPSANNWVDSSVYVNTGFGIAPITLGVATFDGLNKKGYPYNINNPVSYSGPADYLTSRYINLQATSTRTYSPGDSIYLSFYYQAQGFGEAPEMNDSLSVDFWKPNQLKWKKVWGIKGYNPSSTDTSFYRVKIPIADTAYCDSLFRFRFRNNSTNSGSLDHWHVDYVQIKDYYLVGDSTLDDVSFAYKSSPFLKNYSVMPFSQYNRTLEMGTKFRNYIRSNFSIPKFSSYNYTIKDAANTPVATDAYGTFDNPGILPFIPNGYYLGNAAVPVFTLQPFPVTFPDSTYFTIKHVVSTSGDTKKDNDTLVQIQKFTNYYAYDDGSAEQAYYLGGNSYGAKTAVRFTINVADTLKSVRIYFDPVVEGGLIQSSSFRIMVWDNGGNGPGNVRYKDSTMYPTYLSGDYNLFPTYRLTSCLVLPVGTYYVGIQQTTGQPLNIGFDKNTNHKDALYYNTSGSWSQSNIDGSIMINPVLGCTDPPVPVGLAKYEKSSLIRIFPNPAQNTISITYPGNQVENTTLEILTSLGQVVYSKSIVSNETIDVSDLSNGLYFIHLKGSNLNVSSQKLIISR